MNISSIYFIFLFLPAFLLVYYLVPSGQWKNIVLLVLSVVFFGWTDFIHLPTMLLLILLNYVFARWISRLVQKEKRGKAQLVLWLGLIVNILILIFFKYVTFFSALFAISRKIQTRLIGTTMPLGISFFTFTAVAYLIDVYQSSILAEKNIFKFSNFMLMFPKIIQGPITRYEQVRSDLSSSRWINAPLMMEGARRFIGGLAKKVILADGLAVVANKVFNADYAELGAGLAWLGVIAFTLQIYFDFSGYTDMAIGLGKMFGFQLPENFNYPYISKSITDFWRRWHMTLTSWFRNFLFIPLEFARRKEKFLRLQTDILIVFLLTGFWHGSSWNFILWGLYFGVILALETSRWGKWLSKMPTFFQHFITILLIMIGWIFFRIPQISQWKPFFAALFGANSWTGLQNLRSMNILFYIPLLLFSIFVALPIASNLEKKLLSRFSSARIFMDAGYLILFIITVMSLLSNGFSAFMYAKF